MALPQKLQFVFKHFTTVFLPVLPTYKPIIHIINCSGVFTKSFTFQESILIYSVQIRRQVLSKHFCFEGDVLLWLYERKNLPCNSNMADGQVVPISLPWRVTPGFVLFCAFSALQITRLSINQTSQKTKWNAWNQRHLVFRESTVYKELKINGNYPKIIWN